MKTIEEVLMEHQRKSQNIAIRLLDVGKDESSAIISYEVKLKGDEMMFESTITLLPVRRIYKSGAKIVDDEQLLHEMEAEL